MPTRRVLAPSRGVTLLADSVARRRDLSVRLLTAASAFERFGPELARLRAVVNPAASMTVTEHWWRAVPPPFGYAHRLLLLQKEGELQAAICLRERTLLGLPTGLFYGGDAKGECLVLCSSGSETRWLAEGISALFRSRRCAAMLLQRSADIGSCDLTQHFGDHALGHVPRLQVHTQVGTSFWRTALRSGFEQTLAPLGHRTRRNLRHELRRVARCGWRFLPELDRRQVAEATEALASRSTHPYDRTAAAARLDMEDADPNSFSMGLKGPHGEWLSLLGGVRRPQAVTDIFWQSNVAVQHGSVALSMRALLMKYEGERGGSMLRWIGGTTRFLEHCCLPDPASQILVTRSGLRLSMLRHFLGTRLASVENPMQKLLRPEPSGA